MSEHMIAGGSGNSAPLGTVASTGVSTSSKPWSSRKRRSERTIFVRSWKRARASGFTLLEVLGAALIFVAACAVLVGTSGQLVQRVSDTELRLEASELAERELAQIEAVLASQQKPPEDRQEELEDFTLTKASKYDDFLGRAVLLEFFAHW